MDDIPKTPTDLRNGALKIGPTHFVGIGGTGMSGIAEMMLRLGCHVSGSDARLSSNTSRLRSLGAKIFIGHHASNVDGSSAVVFSTAVKSDNAEIVEARARQIPLVHRAEVLAGLMHTRPSIGVSGTHGKTTTTSLIASVLDAGGLDPSVVNGGIISAYDSNCKAGKGDWMVVEADESDGSFLKLNPSIAVVTNIDPEHLDHYYH